MSRAVEAPSSSSSENGKLLVATAVSKSFGAEYAVNNLDFDLNFGEVHALLGPNGSGKSTFIKMLDGVQPQDKGSIQIIGRPRNSKDVATVFQELSLIPSLSVSRNIFLGNELRGNAGLLNNRKMNGVAKELTNSLGLQVHPGELVENLSVASRQLVEIAKAIHRNAKVLVLDEPTATLTANDRDLLFGSIREIRKTGVGIIYVTHRLDEVFEIADRVTVLRDGRKTLSANVSELEMSSLVDAITGVNGATREDVPDEFYENVPIEPKSKSGVPSLEICGLSGERFSNVSLRLHPGQIVGIAGLTGTGRTELLETIAGVRRSTSGHIKLEGESFSTKNVSKALAAGIALVPEDRHGAGVCADHSIERNLALSHSKFLRRGPFMRASASQNLSRELVDALQIKAQSIYSQVQSLSGGNQQKVVFAKWMQPGMKVLLLDEPTQGVDVGARGEIYKVIRRFAQEGGSVLVVSSDFVELQKLCQELYFMTPNRMSDSEPVTPEVTEQYIYAKLSERTGTRHE